MTIIYEIISFIKYNELEKEKRDSEKLLHFFNIYKNNL